MKKTVTFGPLLPMESADTADPKKYDGGETDDSPKQLTAVNQHNDDGNNKDQQQQEEPPVLSSEEEKEQPQQLPLQPLPKIDTTITTISILTEPRRS